MALTINHQTNDISATSGSVTIDGASAGGGPMVHISTTTLSSAAANVEFSGLGTTYEYYKLFYRYKQPTSTSTQYLMWRGMISGSQVSSIYSYHNIINADSDSDYGNAYTGCLLQQVLGEKEVAGEVTFYGIGKSSSRIMAHSNGLHQNSQAPYTSFGLHVGYGQAQSGTWNGIAMVGFFENLPVGATFSLYGIKAS
jgi:hypothetical protein